MVLTTLMLKHLRVAMLALLLSVGSVFVMTYSVFAVIPQDSQLLHYEFTANEGATVSDQSGNGLTGTLVANAAWNAGGYTGGAISFDGEGDKINVVDGWTGFNENFAISVWINPIDDNDAFSTILSTQENGGDSVQILASPQYNFVRCIVGQGKTNRVEYTTWNDVGWHHYLCQRSTAGVLELYRDGVLIQTKSGATTGTLNLSNNNFLRIGGRFDDVQSFNGLIDEVRIYNRTLTAAEVTSLAQNEVGGDAVCGNNLVETGETCDGTNLVGATCQTQGYDQGTLGCLSNCLGYDTSLCSNITGPVCGNNLVEAGEVCDGVDLNGATCQSQGFLSGSLSCQSNCLGYDVNSCTNNTGCGNGVLSMSSGEKCDDANTVGGDGCSATCQVETGWVCAKNSPSSCVLETTGKDCSLTSFNLAPIMDLGTNLYGGFPGGLYGNGSNVRPAAHEAAGVQIANSIVPLNASGTPDSLNGKIALISIGMSNTRSEFERFIADASLDASLNDQLVIVNGAQNGNTLEEWSPVNALPWSVAETRLATAGVTPDQVQVAWVKLTQGVGGLDPNTYPSYAQQFATDLEVIARNLKIHYPNVKLAYFSSRTRPYTIQQNALNPDFFSYEFGFGVKWLIENQINGSPSLAYSGPQAVAPWIAWGPYLWADGTNPRSDGFTWACSDTIEDGVHPSNTGQGKVSGLLLNFFKNDTTSAGWFLDPVGPDVLPPLRSNGSPSGVLPAGTTQTTISLTTHENATCRYATVPNTAYADMTNTFTTTGGISHSTLVSGLVDGSAFDGYVRCQDSSSNANPDDYTISFSVELNLPCTLTSATWSTATATEFDTTTLTVTGSNCDGETINLAVFEDDLLLGEDASDDAALVSPAAVTFSQTTANATWTAEWQNDCAGLCDPPEYYFTASVVSNPGETQRSGLMTVAKAPACADMMDNDGDGAVDGADFACQQGGPSENSVLAECQDGVDNDLDLATDLADAQCLNSQDNQEAQDGLYSDPAVTLLMPFTVNEGTTVTDESGNGHTGSLLNNAMWNSNGYLQGAIAFDGTGDKLNVADNWTGFNENFAISVWINPVDDNDSFGYIMSTHEGSSGNSLQLFVSPQYNFMRCIAGSGKLDRVELANWNEVGWHHYVCQRSTAGVLELYRDGVMVATTNTAIAGTLNIVGNDFLRVGGRFDDLSSFNGLIDEVVTFNRLLTPQEVQTLYTSSGN